MSPVQEAVMTEERGQKPCTVSIVLYWDGEAGSEADARHLCRREGEMVDWNVTWKDEEDG